MKSKTKNIIFYICLVLALCAAMLGVFLAARAGYRQDEKHAQQRSTRWITLDANKILKCKKVQVRPKEALHRGRIFEASGCGKTLRYFCGSSDDIPRCLRLKQ